MKNKLVRVTDSTINELLNNEVILPSSYFHTFHKNAQNTSIDIDDEDFEKEISDLLVEEFEKIDDYMKQTISSIDQVSSATDEIQDAVENNDFEKVDQLNQLLKDVKQQMNDLQSQIYKDPLTMIYNRKWINNYLLQENGNFIGKRVVVLLDIKDFHTLNKKHGEFIGDNILKYFVKFIDNALVRESIKFDFIRFSSDKFIVSVKRDDKNSIKSIFNNLRIELFNKALKTKLGHIIKLTFSYAITDVDKEDDFFSELEKLDIMLKEDKLLLKKGKF